MVKKKSMIILILAMLVIQVLVFQPAQSKANLKHISDSSKQTVANPVSETFAPDAVAGTENIKSNVFYDGGIEEEGSNGEPAGFYGYGSGDNYRNHSYQDEVHAGSYGAKVSSKGTEQYGASYYSGRNFLSISEIAYLDQDITMNLWYNAKANPDYASGAEIYLRLRFSTNLGSYYMFYYLSRVSGLPGNSSTYAYCDIRGSLDSWTNVVRNLTLDFEQAFAAPDISQSYVHYAYFYVTSVANPIGETVMLFDDVSFTNSTGFNFFHQNGDFEDGNSNYWGDGSTGPGSLYRTENDYTQGASAMNCTSYSPESVSRSYIYAERNLYDSWQTIPKGWYARQSGDLIYSFDWKYSDTPTLGTQYAVFYIYSTNSTFDTSFYFILGDENDNLNQFSNYTATTYGRYYYAVDGFGTRDTWNQFSVDFYTLMTAMNLTTQVAYYIGFQVQNNFVQDNTVQLLVDDFQMITYPAGDPSFEGNFLYQASDPILLWSTPNLHAYANITSDAFDGNFAANLTSHPGYNGVYAYRETFYPIVNNQYTDFYWRLDQMTDLGGIGYSSIRLEIDDSRLIHYVLGNNSNFHPTNDSNNCYFFVENHNQIGTWNNVFRNFASDVTDAFGAGNHNLTRIHLYSYAEGTDVVSTIFDHIHFVEDIEGPVISNLVINPSAPEYGEVVEVNLEVEDNLGIQSVELFYKIGSGSWVSTPMVFVADKYTANIPSNDYGITISYYFVATDIYNLNTQLGSTLSPYSYVVADTVNPVLTLEAPPESQILNGTIQFNMTDGYDLGSDIASFEIILNDTTVFNEIVFPATYSWNTETFENGDYHIIFRIEDNAGNIVLIDFLYTVYNPPTSWESFVAFMGQWWPYLTAGAGALTIGILALVIVVKRKKRLAAA